MIMIQNIIQNYINMIFFYLVIYYYNNVLMTFRLVFMELILNKKKLSLICHKKIFLNNNFIIINNF